TLTQVLDTNGPYGPGDHTLPSFHTDGAFLLPAGTYQVNGTYGAIVSVNGAIPAFAGFDVGWNDPLGVIVWSGDEYEQRICQVNVLRNTALAPAWVGYQVNDVFLIQQVVRWEPFLGAGMQLGLHVDPNWHVDLYYLCVL